MSDVDDRPPTIVAVKRLRLSRARVSCQIGVALIGDSSDDAWRADARPAMPDLTVSCLSMSYARASWQQRLPLRRRSTLQSSAAVGDRIFLSQAFQTQRHRRLVVRMPLALGLLARRRIRSCTLVVLSPAFDGAGGVFYTGWAWRVKSGRIPSRSSGFGKR